MAGRILIDTGFWIGLFSPRDQHHAEAKYIIQQIERERILIPWVVLFEVFRTRFVRDPTRVQEFKRFLTRPNIVVFDETRYRVQALEALFQYQPPNLSLVDCILRETLKDSSMQIGVFVTFNRADFEDICQLYRVQILSQNP